MEKNKNINCFILSNIINRFGDSVDLIAFMWLTYEITNSILFTGIVAAFNGIPSIVLGVFSGFIADHWSKKKLIMIGDLARGIIVLVIIVLFKIKLLNMPILCVSTILISTFEIIAAPARRSMIPFLVEKDELKKINSKLSTGKIIAQISGLALSGVIINSFGAISAVMIDAITFFISFALIYMIKFQDNSKEINKQYSSILSEIKDSVRVITKQNIIFKTTLMATFVNIFIGCFNVLSLSYCENILKNDSKGQSIINIASILGILTVSILFSNIKEKIKIEKIIDIGFIGLGVSFLLFGICQNNILAYLIAYGYGLATGCITITSVTILHKNIPFNHMGKVMAVVSLTNESSIPLGNLMAGILLRKIKINTIFLGYGFIIVVVCMLMIKIFDGYKNNDKLLDRDDS